MKNTSTARIHTKCLVLVFSFLCLFFYSCRQPEVETFGTEYPVNVEVLAEGFDIPWAIDVIDEEDFLISERMGGLYRYRHGELQLIEGLPKSQTYKSDRHYGGNMDVSLHPKFKSNQWVYLAYVNLDYHLSVVRFKLEGNQAIEPEIIYTSNYFSIGSRIAWQDDKHFFLTFGLGGTPKPDPGSQDLDDPRGKILRLKADGSLPDDNPVFPAAKEPLGIWTYGHRDPQGLYYDTKDSILYSNEHGPLGGDELNIIQKGENYGWPLFSYGLNYDVTKVSDMTEEQAALQTILPIKYWEPHFRLAPSSLLKLENSNFEPWNGSFLIGGLSYQCLVRYHPGTDETEIVWPEAGRVRDVAQLPSGDLVVLIDEGTPNWWRKGRIVKLTPNL